MARENRVKLTTTYPHGGKLHRDIYASFAEAYQGLSNAGFLNFSGACGSKVPRDTQDFIIEPEEAEEPSIYCSCCAPGTSCCSAPTNDYQT